VTRARLLALAALIVAAAFAYWGGTFSEPNYRVLRRDEAMAAREVAKLQHEVDSLRIFLDSLATNPVVQERIARDQYGMLRPGELMFTIVITDSGRRDSVVGKGRGH
jgi:cell division protein FtsB